MSIWKTIVGFFFDCPHKDAGWKIRGYQPVRTGSPSDDELPLKLPRGGSGALRHREASFPMPQIQSVNPPEQAVSSMWTEQFLAEVDKVVITPKLFRDDKGNPKWRWVVAAFTDKANSEYNSKPEGSTLQELVGKRPVTVPAW
jgi:hypothetical protein